MILVPVAGKSLTMINSWDTNDTYVSILTYDYYIGKYEVTYALWYEVSEWAKLNGYTFANKGIEGNLGVPGDVPSTGKYEPVSTINWRDAIIWCNAYSEREGLTLVYYTDAGFQIPLRNSSDGSYSDSVNLVAGSYDNPYVKWNANGYRLPTEGEWEYAARYQDGMTWTPFNYLSGASAGYADKTASFAVGVFHSYSDLTLTGVTKTANIGTKMANSLGIKDMSGNLYEWCWDWFGNYPGSVQNDYRGVSLANSNPYSRRLLRGGGWNYPIIDAKTGHRGYGYPFGESNSSLGFGIGFRVARSL